MKTLSTLKTLPLVGLMALGVAMTPVVSEAAPGAIGHVVEKQAHKQGGGKGHYRDGNRSHRGDKGSHKRDRDHYKGHKKYGHKVREHVVYRGRGPKYGIEHHGYKHHGYDHGHTDYVIVHDSYPDYDPLRLLLGLHFDNIDIIYRDY